MTSAVKSVAQAALMALLSFALGAGLAGFGAWEHKSATRDAEESVARLGAVRSRLQILEAPEIEELAGRLAEIYARGFFAAATPQDLASRLQEARDALGLVEARAIFSPTTPWGNTVTPLWQGYLELELDLNHEQEFVDFWGALEWPGPLRLIDCALERNPARAAPNLKAACRLQWLTGAQMAEEK
ncbi:MAG: hypothetical protein LBF93_00655 [Zoogloeaceae bacterium]|jgi:hypothetical protein|nr:hypothetical protein [Zoogloeaceae bacterium]